MQKRVTIIAIVIVTLVFLATVVGLYLSASSSYNKQAVVITKKTDESQTQVNVLKASKDANGFTATEVVKYFFDEVKSDSIEKAKLYLAPEVQNMDIAATLKLGSDLANVGLGENLEAASDENMAVSMTFVLPSEETTVRTFELSKYDDVWKITGVVAE